jgi:predicted transcriptional regulator
LKGRIRKNYTSRSEPEQAIINGLVNAGFSFEEVLTLFRQYPAAGRFREMDSEDPQRAIDWLRLSFDQARSWCIQISPGRKFAADVFSRVSAMRWPGRTGSADRAVYIAHTGIAYRAGKIVYHASTRDLGELAGCSRITAARATKRLLRKGLIEQKQPSAFTFAAKYQLTEKTNIDPLPHNGFKGVVQTSSFLIPEAFRHRGLGRSGYEVLNALETGPLTANEISGRTGRHIQTVRGALKRLRKVGLAVKSKKLWCGRGLEDVNLDDLARAVGMKGALQHQRERHSADRLRHKMSVVKDESKLN